MDGVKGVHFGAGYDLESRITTNLFIVCANNSGSTFLKVALATRRRTWNLNVEGQFMFGFVGPNTRTHGRLLWGADPRWRGVLADDGACDWPRNRHAWYFQANALEPAATVFTTKAPPFLLHVEALSRHFRNARFLFMVRTPTRCARGSGAIGWISPCPRAGACSRRPRSMSRTARSGSGAISKPMRTSAPSSPTRRCATSRNGSRIPSRRDVAGRTARGRLRRAPC